MNNWQRLEQVIKWTGMSTHAFALAIGLKRSENLYQIKRGSFGISKELARLITTKYPMVSRSWLITGDGQMLSGASNEKEAEQIMSQVKGAVPFYQLDILTLANVQTDIRPTYHLVLPMFVGATFAANCIGTSMYPSIPSGSTVVVRECSITSILPGETYLIATNDFVVLRKVRSMEGQEDKIMLVADNSEHYDTFSIEKNRINKVYVVVGVLINQLA